MLETSFFEYNDRENIHPVVCYNYILQSMFPFIDRFLFGKRQWEFVQKPKRSRRYEYERLGKQKSENARCGLLKLLPSSIRKWLKKNCYKFLIFLFFLNRIFCFNLRIITNPFYNLFFIRQDFILTKVEP